MVRKSLSGKVIFKQRPKGREEMIPEDMGLVVLSRKGYFNRTKIDDIQPMCQRLCKTQ